MAFRGEMDDSDWHNNNDNDKIRMTGRKENKYLRLGLYMYVGIYMYIYIPSNG